MASKCETGSQLLVRLNPRTEFSDLEPLLFPTGLKHKDVVEIFGNEGTGKTGLLLHFILKCILPKTLENICIGGLELDVVFIDTDYHFNLLHLVGMLEKKFQSFSDLKSYLKKNIESCIKQCLQRLHIVQCISSLQLLSTLHSLDVLLASLNNVAIIMIDSISAFYWADRSVSDKCRMNQIICVLHQLIQNYNLAIILTKQALFSVPKESSSDTSDYFESECDPEFEFLGKKYQKFVTQRIFTSRIEDSQKIKYYCQYGNLVCNMLISDHDLKLEIVT